MEKNMDNEVETWVIWVCLGLGRGRAYDKNTLVIVGYCGLVITSVFLPLPRFKLEGFGFGIFNGKRRLEVQSL